MAPEAALILDDGTEVPLLDELTIGRGEDNHLTLDATTVSRRHAVLTRRDGRWFVADCGSFNGTYLNGDRLPPGFAMQLRHTDRIGLGSVIVLFSAPSQLEDTEQTEPVEERMNSFSPQLSPLQRQVVGCLCERWLAGGNLDLLPTNQEIAARLGTPGATDTVKAALRRAYAKAGLSEGSMHSKRRALCRVARQRGWI